MLFKLMEKIQQNISRVLIVSRSSLLVICFATLVVSCGNSDTDTHSSPHLRELKRFDIDLTAQLQKEDREFWGFEFAIKNNDVDNVNVKIYFSYSKTSDISPSISSLISPKDILITKNIPKTYASKEYLILFGTGKYENSYSYILRDAYDERKKGIQSSLVKSLAIFLVGDDNPTFEKFCDNVYSDVEFPQNVIYVGQPLRLSNLERPYKVFIIFEAEGYKSRVASVNNIYSFKWNN